MPILTKDTPALQIHGQTKQEVAECLLEEGTEYELRTRTLDALRHRWWRISVDGYLYDVEATALEEN